MINHVKWHAAKVIGIFCLLLFSQSIFGQSLSGLTGDAKQFKNALAIVPQYAFYHGFRIDYERKIKNSDQWIVLAPQIYSDISNNNYYYYSSTGYSAYQSMVGFGINAYYKLMVFKSARKNLGSNLPRHALYFSAGPNFQYFKLKNMEEVAHPFIEDGVTYYKFELEDVTKPIYRIGAIANVGWQFTFDRFLIDFYFGLAIKYSLDEDGKLIRDTYSDWVDPAYSGVLLDGGVRLGFFFQ